MALRIGAPDRRARTRGTVEGEPARTDLVRMIVGTYREMPGLCLRVDQAARLFGLRRRTCEIVLDALVEQRRLRLGVDRQYRQDDAEPQVATRVPPYAAH